MTRGPLGLGTDFESIRDYSPDDDVRTEVGSAELKPRSPGRPSAVGQPHDAEPGAAPTSGVARHPGCGKPPRLATSPVVVGYTNRLWDDSPGNRPS